VDVPIPLHLFMDKVVGCAGVFVIGAETARTRLKIKSCDRSREEHLRGMAEEDSVVQNHIEQRFMNPDAAVILNKAELAKAIHEEADA
jgi:hypothetical protein